MLRGAGKAGGRAAVAGVSMSSSGGRQRAISEMFELVERRFGNIQDLEEPGAGRVITIPELDSKSLNALFKHEACAIHVPGFYDSTASAR
jgi:hypothetical protein